MLRRASHVQQAKQAVQSLPATASASCDLPAQQNEPNMQSAVESCDLSVLQVPRLQTQIQPELQSMKATAQHKAQRNKADECAPPNCSSVNVACDSSTAYALQPGRCQQAAQPHSSQQEAQPAAHDGPVSHTLAACSSATASVDGKASRTSSHGSVWLPQSSLLPEVHCRAARAKGKQFSQKRMLSGVASHKSVRRSLRHQAKALA